MILDYIDLALGLAAAYTGVRLYRSRMPEPRVVTYVRTVRETVPEPVFVSKHRTVVKSWIIPKHMHTWTSDESVAVGDGVLILRCSTKGCSAHIYVAGKVQS